MKNQDWKLKYSDLKLKFHDAVDTAFRLGFEAGAQNAQNQQAQAALQPPMPGQDPNAAPGEDPNSPGTPDGSELDQHINQLESMVNQGQSGAPDQAAMQKSLAAIKAFQKSLKDASDLKKNEKAIKEIGKAMKAPFTLSKSATKNLSESGKKALSMQEQIVDELMKSMADEEAKATDAITKTLSLEQLLKG